MVLTMFAVFDLKSGVYGTPFFVVRDPDAVRSFAAAVQGDPGESMLSRWPADYSLFKLGEFDPESGKIASFSPVHIASGASLVAAGTSSEGKL